MNNSELIQKIIKYEHKIRIMSGAGYNKYKTINNDGNSGTMTNQCFWISIQQYLQKVLNKTYTIIDLKKIASMGIHSVNNDHDFFDTEKHFSALVNLANRFNMIINFYINDPTTQSISEHPSFTIIGANPVNMVNIVFYGAHFELIISFDGIHFFDGFDIKNAGSFEPKKDLVLGKKTDDYYNPVLDELTQLSVVLSTNIAAALVELDKEKQNIVNLQNEHIDAKRKAINEKDILDLLIATYEETVFIQQSAVDYCENKVKKLIEQHEKILKTIQDILL